MSHQVPYLPKNIEVILYQVPYTPFVKILKVICHKVPYLPQKYQSNLSCKVPYLTK